MESSRVIKIKDAHEQKRTKKNITKSLLFFLLAFLGIGAIGGGGLLIISPSGEMLGTPLYLLDKSPFSNFLIPGIFLFFVLGVAPILLIIALWKKRESNFAERINFFKDMHWSWSYTIYVGFALIIWIQVQMELIDTVYWLHTFYMFFALVILFVALQPQVRNFYKK